MQPETHLFTGRHHVKPAPSPEPVRGLDRAIPSDVLDGMPAGWTAVNGWTTTHTVEVWHYTDPSSHLVRDSRRVDPDWRGWVPASRPATYHDALNEIHRGPYLAYPERCRIVTNMHYVGEREHGQQPTPPRQFDADLLVSRREQALARMCHLNGPRPPRWWQKLRRR